MENNSEPVDMDLIDLDGSNSAADSSSDEINSRFVDKGSVRHTHVSKLQSPVGQPDEKSSDSSRRQLASTRDASPYRIRRNSARSTGSNSNSSCEDACDRSHSGVAAKKHTAKLGTHNPGSASDGNSSCSSTIRRSDEAARSYTSTSQPQSVPESASSQALRKQKAPFDDTTRSRPSSKNKNDYVKMSSSDRKRIRRRRRSSSTDSDDSRIRYKRRHCNSRKSSRHRHRRSSRPIGRRIYPRESQSISPLTSRPVNSYASKAFKDYGPSNDRSCLRPRDTDARNIENEVEKRVRVQIEQRVAEELEKRKAQIQAAVRSKIAQEQTRMYAELKSELEVWRNEERRKMLQQEDEQKKKREELEILIAENNSKIEEQHRRIAEEHMRLLDEQRKLVEQKERIEAEQKRRATDEQAMVLGKRGTRPKLSFQLGQKFLN